MCDIETAYNHTEMQCLSHEKSHEETFKAVSYHFQLRNGAGLFVMPPSMLGDKKLIAIVEKENLRCYDKVKVCQPN